MDVRVGLGRKLSTEELMLLNCDVEEDFWESFGLQGDPTSPSWRKPVLNVYWKDWCWSWSSNTLATSCEVLTSLEKTLMLGGIGGRRRRGRQRMRWLGGITDSMDIPVNSGRWWWTGTPGVLRFMGSQRVGYNWVTELPTYFQKRGWRRQKTNKQTNKVRRNPTLLTPTACRYCQV